MAKWEDYKHLARPTEENVIEAEVAAAAEQQETREESTPDVDWQKRYKDLEVEYSRQGQQVGDYRQLVDSYINSTPDGSEAITESPEVSPITPDDIYDNPDQAINKAIDQHPAIKRAKELEQELEQTRRDAVMGEFNVKHPSFQETVKSDEFANWIREDESRFELLKRADTFDMISADALFSLYEASKAPAVGSSEPNIDDVALESGSGAEAPAPDRYSRSEMLRIMTLAKQGDMAADAYYKEHAAKYREALTAGNVRD
jgi:hypothetical protein